MMERPTLKCEAFEGPMDLLLFLIGKNKVNIFDIPIAELLDQYMAVIEELREDTIELASEFLEMAARLVQIKTAMLLPKSEEGQAMRDALAIELMEYQTCRLAAAELREISRFDTFVRPPSELEWDKTYTRKHDPFELASAWLAVAGRGKRRLPPEKKEFAGMIRQEVSVAWGVFSMLRRLKKDGNTSFTELLSVCQGREQMVAMFIALLELVKSGRVGVQEDRVELIARRQAH